MNHTRLQIAKPDIIRTFEALKSPVLKLGQIRSILAREREFWRLTQSISAADLITFLTQHAKLQQIEFPFPRRAETLFIWGDVPAYTILLGLRPDAYFSHYTAMRLHGLTEQTSTTLYITDERTAGAREAAANLTQMNIDQAFARPPRASHNTVVYEGRNVCLLNGAHTGQLGVVTERVNDDDGQDVEVRTSNLERTLVDITVRPFYAGGLYEVAKAFELSRERISVNKLMTTLRKLDFSYPYHQAIGYYLERAQFKSTQLDLARRIPIERDFYLTHDMGPTRYVSDWRLFVPEGF